MKTDPVSSKILDSFLCEGAAYANQLVSQGNLPVKILDAIKRIDPTGKRKYSYVDWTTRCIYSEFSLKELEGFDYSISFLAQITQRIEVKYTKLLARLDSARKHGYLKDFSDTWSSEKTEAELTRVEPEIDAKKVKPVRDYTLIHETDKVRILRIHTQTAAVVYGCPGIWCISSRGDSTHWDRYTGQGDTFYFFTSKTDKDDRWCMQIHNIGTKTIWNPRNKTETPDIIYSHFDLQAGGFKLDFKGGVQTVISVPDYFERLKQDHRTNHILTQGKDIADFFIFDYSTNMSDFEFISQQILLQEKIEVVCLTSFLIDTAKDLPYTSEISRIRNMLETTLGLDVGKAVIKSNYSVYYKGGVSLGYLPFKRLDETGIVFEKILGNLHIHNNEELVSIENFVKEAIGEITLVSNHRLKSLKGLSTIDFGSGLHVERCSALTSLDGCPERLFGNLYVIGNKELKSLEGIPKKVTGDVRLLHNGRKFTEEEVRAVCKVGGSVFVGPVYS